MMGTNAKGGEEYLMRNRIANGAERLLSMSSLSCTGVITFQYEVRWVFGGAGKVFK